jgi:hypothetical protein
MAVHTGLNACLHLASHVSHRSYIPPVEPVIQAQIIDLIEFISYRDWGIWK